MYDTALIALDISPAEVVMPDCLDDLRAMGVARVVLLHVVRTGWTQGAALARHADYADWLEGHAAPLRAAGLEVTADVRAALEPAAEIRAAAAEHGADLIVIGSRGQSTARGLFLGSTARDVLRHSTLPVRLEWIEADGSEDASVCARACDGGLRRVLLATDFSPQARAAEEAAASLARHAGSVTLLHVTDAQEAARYTRWPVMARAALDAIAQDIAAAGGQAEPHLAEGKPSEAIARLAQDRDADLIVVGKHGQSWVESMIIGSTAAKLCEIARRPVLMVPTRAGG